MELVMVVIGMILAFLAGAYVRRPFVIRQQEERPEAVKTEESKQERRTRIQLENMLAYNGTKQGDADED